MPPIFVDGVEMDTVFIDGVAQDSVWVDGVQVFSAFQGEDYRDDFTTSGLATPLTAHTMNTGQSWAVSNTGAVALIQNGLDNAAGQRCSRVNIPNGQHSEQRLTPQVGLVNTSFICRVSFTWQPAVFALLAASATMNLDVAMGISGVNLQVLGGADAYATAIIIGGVISQQINVANNQFGCDMEMFYDGVDVAGVITVRPSNQRVVFTRRSAQGTVDNNGRSFHCLSQLVAGVSNVFTQIFNVEEIGVPPAAMPWPT